ncbi:COG1361 S-layer family protein [Methanosarcina sp.]|uniref:COG1361 S-layer family protein n=1 Tax=Methanosarcina sp. TaxID=2213 RepID=UPI0029893A49|nr:COG1361 S-layer family protein [Methanosarcina sp.]MDW5552003.1 COG1361 S-layer family protein [Methanosarcina sp.]MDW5555765.1 COG1361 S-layer family protein [Methanosarcina sp.]MDW5561287.1 COG1361 S-layer family protein [Methanosarcina sp.]
MRKFSLLTFLLLLSTFLCLGVGTAFGGSNGNINSAAVQVNVTNQNPDTARPGEPVELTLSVQNIGNDDLKDIKVALNPEYPFSKLSGEDLEKSISYLNARQDDDDAGVLKFKLMTDANASEGTYDLDIVTTYKSGSGSSATTYTTKQTVPIEVQGKEYAQVVTVSKADIDIAKEEPLEFIVTNTGASPLKNLVFSWTDPKGVVLPVYSDNTKYIKYLEAGQSVKVDYTVMADVSASPGLYTLNVNLSYENSDSNSKNIQTTAGLFVGGVTDFDVSFSESSAGETSLSVANVGNNIAYAVKVSIPDQDEYKVSGSSSTIVGNLEKGDYTIASFNVANSQGDAGGNTTGNSPGTTPPDSSQAGANGASSNSMNSSNPLKVQIEYTNAKGERETVTKEVNLGTTTSGNMTAAGGSGGPGNSAGVGSYLPYIGLIIIAGGAFVYRKKIHEKIQTMKAKKAGYKKPEDQKN